MKLRVSAVQYHLHTIQSFEDFAMQCEHYIKTALEFDSDFIVFPEFLTTQLLSFKKQNGSNQTIHDLPSYTEQYEDLFLKLAKKYNIHIIGGTHVVEVNNQLRNTAFFFDPEGRIMRQEKPHITPVEISAWNMAKGEELKIFDTKYGKIAILTCYDIEFPEIVRIAKARGADIIFCPSCTDNQHGYYRVRYTSHARAIENQVYVVLSGTVGSLPTVDFMRSNFSQATIITPNDIPFPPKGVLAEGEVNQDMIITADLDLNLLYEVRNHGSVTTWKDRRTDLYTDW